jgi:hypothetical protein
MRQNGRADHITVTQKDTDTLFTQIATKMINAIGIERRCSAFYSVDLVTLV